MTAPVAPDPLIPDGSRYPSQAATPANGRTRSLPPAAPQLLAFAESLIDPLVIALALAATLATAKGALGGGELTALLIAFWLAYPGARRYRDDSWRLLRTILKSWVLVAAPLLALAAVSGYASGLRLEVVIGWVVLTPLLVWAARLLFVPVLRASCARQEPRRALVVGAGPLGQSIADAINTTPYRSRRVVAFFDDRDAARLRTGVSTLLRGDLDAVAAFVNAEAIDVVYVTLPLGAHPRIVRLLESLKDTTASVYFVPDVFAIDLIQSRMDEVGGVPVVAVCESPLRGGNALRKRVLDLVVALAALALAAPVMVSVAAAIRLTSPGPVIFKQRRYGLDGQEIMVWKFRSMTVTEDGALQYRQVARGDARVTPVGRLIRWLSLDELPQLFNVLQGTMSIVGPRPHAVAVNETYRKLIPGYMIRHKVKPGITGWAQINGCRGGDDIESMKRRIELDLDYLRRWSLSLDMLILLKTTRVVFAGDRNAY
jgi:putative colanic acid biosysnthesis UDP-glucose lipid carrier transferase